MTTAAVAEMESALFSINKVIVAASVRPGCESTIGYAAGIAGRFKARLYLTYVFWPSREARGDYHLMDKEELAGRDRLEYLTEEARRIIPDCRAVFLIGEEETERILAFAREVDADLIIAATHHRNVLARLFVLDKAAKIVSKAPCSVLVYHNNVGEFSQVKKSGLAYEKGIK
jgi:nucleotide-binding universal stress UspA family protein